MLKPIGTKVFVKLIESDRSKGGLFLPEGKAPKIFGTVISVGNKCKHLTKDQVIILPFVNFTPIKHEDELYYLIEEKDVLSKLEYV